MSPAAIVSLLVVASVLLACVTAPTEVRARSASGGGPPTADRGLFGDTYPLEILPQVELVSAALSKTTWMDQWGPSGAGGNEYFQAMSKLLEPFRDHTAVKIAQRLNDRGFQYDAVPCFACHLGPLPDLALTHEYSDYVAQRAGGRQQLEEFRIALRSLAQESDFVGFLEEWRSYLEESVRETSRGFEPDRIVTWLIAFYGEQPAEFHMILAPAMFSGGGYGATVYDSGKKLVYEIVRESGRGINRPEFPTGRSLGFLALHEWGHAFVNPAVQSAYEKAGGTLVNKLYSLYSPVSSRMSSMAYGNVRTFLCEQVLRGATAVGARELYGYSGYRWEMSTDESVGFYLTSFAVKQLREYSAQRDQYPAFADFVPYLLSKMADSGIRPGRQVDWYRVAGVAIVACLASGFIFVTWGVPVYQRWRWFKKRGTPLTASSAQMQDKQPPERNTGS